MLFRLSLFLCSGMFILTGCAVARVYDTKSVRASFSEALVRSGEMASKTTHDFTDKKAIYDHIVRDKKHATSKVVAQLHPKIQSMETHVQRINQLKLRMTDLNGQFSAMAYSKIEIRTTDPGGEAAHQLIEDFKKATDEINAELKAYSKHANAFAALVDVHKLYARIDLREFDRNLLQAINQAKEALRPMSLRYQKSQRPELYEPIKTVSSHIEKIEKMRDELANRFSAKPVVSTADPEWLAISELKSKYDSYKAKLEDGIKQFEKLSQGEI